MNNKHILYANRWTVQSCFLVALTVIFNDARILYNIIRLTKVNV